MHKYLKITYSHWYFEELQVLTEVVLVHYVCAHDKLICIKKTRAKDKTYI
jgi:hypothetical protein